MRKLGLARWSSAIDKAVGLHEPGQIALNLGLAAHHPQLGIDALLVKGLGHLQRQGAALALPVNPQKQQPTGRWGALGDDGF